MKEKEIINDIISWLDSSTGYLSTKTPYGKGYRNGILMAKDIIREIIKDHDANLLSNN